MVKVSQTMFAVGPVSIHAMSCELQSVRLGKILSEI